ncbi:carboxymuconolactone decarboxylase family protein [Bordetella petrii]|nr:carboxymuconolactone decarboxylase family protein [Bordetella petrii]
MPQDAASLNALGADAHAKLDAALIELLEVRASQINGCAFCIQYHLSLARKAGLQAAKIDLLAAWREAGDIYTPAERAALAWTEHLTDISRQGAPDPAWQALQEHFSDEQIVSLCVVIASINAWNRIAIALAFQPMGAK